MQNRNLTAIKVSREISDFHGDCMMVGCGHGNKHSFRFLSNTVHSLAIHPPELFYHVSLRDYSDEGMLDIEGDFLSENILKYLSDRKFNLICFEAISEIFNFPDLRDKAIEQAKALLSKNGICFIYFGGRNNQQAMQEVISKFNYSYLFTYGEYNTWSLISSDEPFDLLEVMEKNIYLKYIGKEVLLKSPHLAVSYNYYENALQRHIVTADPADIELLKTFNPFVLFKSRFINSSITARSQLKTSSVAPCAQFRS